MGNVILGYTVSLDGYVEDSLGSVNALYPDHELLVQTEYMKESILTTGAVVMSRKEYDMADDVDLYADYYEYQVPIFVFTDQVPDKHPKENENLTFTFITSGIKDAISQAKVAAGERDVNIIGSALTSSLSLNSQLVDELQIDTIPIFLQHGFRPFDLLVESKITFERTKVIELPSGRVHMTYKCRY